MAKAWAGLFGVLLVAWVIATFWWVLVLAGLGALLGWLAIRYRVALAAFPGRARAHVQEIYQVQVKLRREARVKRIQELKYPTYIRRWSTERRAAEAKAHIAFNNLFNALLEETGHAHTHGGFAPRVPLR